MTGKTLLADFVEGLTFLNDEYDVGSLTLEPRPVVIRNRAFFKRIKLAKPFEKTSLALSIMQRFTALNAEIVRMLSKSSEGVYSLRNKVAVSYYQSLPYGTCSMFRRDILSL